jgi:hypothetical protein
MAGNDAPKQAYMLERLAEAKRQKLSGARLQTWLESAAAEYRSE